MIYLGWILFIITLWALLGIITMFNQALASRKPGLFARFLILPLGIVMGLLASIERMKRGRK